MPSLDLATSVFPCKVVAEYKAQKKAAKKKKKKKKQKKEKKAAKKDKKDKQLGKTAKKEKKRSKARGSSQDDLPGEEVKKERHEVKEKRRKRIVLDDAGQPTGKEELEVLQAALIRLAACAFCRSQCRHLSHRSEAKSL